jgi:hypothetical protein
MKDRPYLANTWPLRFFHTRTSSPLTVVRLWPKYPASSEIIAESRAVGRGEAVVGDPEGAVKSTEVLVLGFDCVLFVFISGDGWCGPRATLALRGKLAET